MGRLGRLDRPVERVKSWDLWQLPRPGLVLVLSVIAAYTGGVAVGVWQVAVIAHGSYSYLTDAVTTAVFTLAAIASVEISMRLAWPRARKDRLSRDFLGVWLVPIALLMPPVYVAVAVVVPYLYLHLRVWRGQPIKRIYTVAVLGLAYGTASLVHRALLHVTAQSHVNADQFTRGLDSVVSIGIAVAIWWTINVGLVAAVVILTGGKEPLRAYLKDREGYAVDCAAACLGTLAAVLWATNPIFAILLVPPVLLLQHQLFSGLRQAVRTDLLTEVANPQFWREVAGREVDRAAASGSNVAILMIDVDHFKSVNDRHGHLAGDEVLATVARTIAQTLRPGDLVGRLGGEEFGAILGGLNLLDAEGAAERLRSQVAEARVRSDAGDWITVTVSVGVSELSVTGGDLHHLLDAADTALYAAKAAGRNCVRAAGPTRIIDLSVSADPARADQAEETPA
jgi:diguanylate cyclase (GGDEF)-like protein